MKKGFILLLALFLYATVSSAQQVKVTGVVTSSDDKQSMIGVNVIVKGTTRGVVTDFDGRYTISASPDEKITYQYMGYMPQVMIVKKSQTVINVVLVPDSKMLQEVVAVGYGTMKKSDLTGSISSISSEKLKLTPASGIDQALQGKAAGVTVNANSGQPGAAAEVRIRGIGTINNSNAIYVVDGVILDNINFLSPSDIMSTEILKDASATAIYGSRGANGVILISTRKGSDTGVAHITFDSYVGVQNRWRKLDLMGKDDFANFKAISGFPGSETLKNTDFNKWIESYFTGKTSKTKGAYSYFPLVKSTLNPNGFDYSTVETDWQDEVFQKNAMIQNYYIGADGGNKTSKYAVSSTFFNQDGTLMGSWYKRLTLRINTSHQLKSWLKVGENLSFMRSSSRNSNNNNINSGILSSALSMAPWDPTHYPNGTKSYPYIGNESGRDLSGKISASTNFKNVVNPFSMVENANPDDRYQRWVGDAFVEITPFKGFVLRSDISMDLSDGQSKLYKPAYIISAYDQSALNYLMSSMSRFEKIIYETTATYNAKINRKNDITLLVGTTTEEFNSYSISGSGQGFPNAVPENWYLSKIPSDNRTPAGDAVGRTRMNSYLGRLHYVYDNKYLATVNYRVDGSSNFPKENVWAKFPSVALGWRINSEPFFEPLNNTFEVMKLRLGWGRIGNQSISSNSFSYNVFNSGPTFVDYVLGTTPALATGATVLTYPKTGIWETTEQYNIGLDFGLRSGVLSGSVELFEKNTKDMLLAIKGPAYVGNRYDAIDNAGAVRNKGVEFTLDHKGKIGRVNYGISGNASFISNELTALNGADPVWNNNFGGDDLTLSNINYPLFTFWGYKYDGVFKSAEEIAAHVNSAGKVIQPTAEPGDARFIDLNNDGEIDKNDKASLGNPFPWMTYGLTFSLDYKGLDFQVFFQGVKGNEIYNALRYRTEGKGDESTLSPVMNDMWSSVNPNGSIPNPFGANNFRASSRFVEDGSYLRLKTAQIGYTLPVKFTRNIGIEKCRFYISGSNLLTVTSYTGYDPEVGGGIDYGNYPQSRTILLGATINF